MNAVFKIWTFLLYWICHWSHCVRGAFIARSPHSLRPSSSLRCLSAIVKEFGISISVKTIHTAMLKTWSLCMINLYCSGLSLNLHCYWVFFILVFSREIRIDCAKLTLEEVSLYLQRLFSIMMCQSKLMFLWLALRLWNSCMLVSWLNNVRLVHTHLSLSLFILLILNGRLATSKPWWRSTEASLRRRRRTLT
jgi:hypothetical protein